MTRTYGAFFTIALAMFVACSVNTEGQGDFVGGGGFAGSDASAGGEAGANADAAPDGNGGTGGAAGASGEAGQAGQAGSGAAGTGGGGGVAGTGCGDGKAEPPEQCDDGNAKDGDGCSTTCQVECDGRAVDQVTFHCYWVHSGILDDDDWNNAKDRCAKDGGHLATITSSEEDAFVQSLRGGELWIGGTDGKDVHASGAGTYTWITGEPWQFNNWASGEPSASGTSCDFFTDTCYEHCAELRGDGLWNDRRCDQQLDFACEWDPPGW